jgi:hypothetical protein
VTAPAPASKPPMTSLPPTAREAQRLVTAATPGQAAYEEFAEQFPAESWGSWEQVKELPMGEWHGWEKVGQAAIAAQQPQPAPVSPAGPELPREKWAGPEAARGTLRADLESQVRLWKHEAEPDANDDGQDGAVRDAIGVCASELAEILDRHPMPKAAPLWPDGAPVRDADGEPEAVPEADDYVPGSADLPSGQRDVEEITVRPAPELAEPEYPRQDGEFTVIGPECFADRDSTVIAWKGENYYRAYVKSAPQPAPELAAAIPLLGLLDDFTHAVIDLDDGARLVGIDRIANAARSVRKKAGLPELPS